MSMTLAALVAKVTAAVPTRNGAPSADQYEGCVQDAAEDLSARKSHQKVVTLSIVAGTGSYALPSDFLRAIRIEALLATDGVLISDVGLIPVDAAWEELYTYAGQTLTITPTPVYTTSRRLLYVAGHVLDGAEAYPDMTTQEGALVALKAQALALGLQANAALREGWKYQIGDEMVDKAELAAGFSKQAAALDEVYRRAVLAAVGPYGSRG